MIEPLLVLSESHYVVTPSEEFYELKFKLLEFQASTVRLGPPFAAGLLISFPGLFGARLPTYTQAFPPFGKAFATTSPSGH